MKLTKLKGTKTEHDIRNQLIKTHKALFNEEKNVRLDTLREYFPGMKTAYILNSVPDQGEDIITFLIDNNVIAEIEIDRYDATVRPIVETKPFNEEYINGLRKMSQITIAIALELANSNIKMLE